MILFDTNSPALRYAASLISGVENEDEPVKVVIGDGEVYFTLKCGLKIKTPVWKGDYDVSDFDDCSEFTSTHASSARRLTLASTVNRLRSCDRMTRFISLVS